LVKPSRGPVDEGLDLGSGAGHQGAVDAEPAHVRELAVDLVVERRPQPGGSAPKHPCDRSLRVTSRPDATRPSTDDIAPTAPRAPTKPSAQSRCLHRRHSAPYLIRPQRKSGPAGSKGADNSCNPLRPSRPRQTATLQSAPFPSTRNRAIDDRLHRNRGSADPRNRDRNEREHAHTPVPCPTNCLEWLCATGTDYHKRPRRSM
jgi:hypothetical protein